MFLPTLFAVCELTSSFLPSLPSSLFVVSLFVSLCCFFFIEVFMNVNLFLFLPFRFFFWYSSFRFVLFFLSIFFLYVHFSFVSHLRSSLILLPIFFPFLIIFFSLMFLFFSLSFLVVPPLFFFLSHHSPLFTNYRFHLFYIFFHPYLILPYALSLIIFPWHILF